MNWKRIKLFFTLINYDTCIALSSTITYWLNNYEVERIQHEKCFTTIHFQNGNRLRFWSKNKWYAWASRGRMISKNGSFDWDDKMPSKDVMVMLDDKLEKYAKTKPILC